MTLILAAFTLPLDLGIARIVVPIFILVSIFNLQFSKEKIRFILPYTIFFIVTVIGLLYSEDQSNAFKNIEVKLSFLFFPILFLFSKFDYRGTANNALKSFVVGSLFAVVLGLVKAGLNTYETGSFKPFFYGDIALYHHNSYTSLYYNFVVIIMYVASLAPRKGLYLAPFRAFLGIGLFTLIIIMLGSKAGILTIGLVHIAAMGYWVFQHKRYTQGIASIILFGGISLGAYLFSPTLQTRINEVFSSLSKENTEHSSSSTRLVTWSTGIEIIKENPIMGVGIGDAQIELNKKYNEKEHYDLSKRNLNPHNQFIQTQIASGLIGSLAFLFALFHHFKLAFREKLWIYIGLVCLFAINNFFESMLEKQDGVVFFMFFSSLLLTRIAPGSAPREAT